MSKLFKKSQEDLKENIIYEHNKVELRPKDVHSALLAAQQYLYEPNELMCSNIVQEEESKEYGAYEFEINNLRIKFRVAKITPTKIGQFVTFWKRVGKSVIMPYDMNDSFDLLVVSVRSNNNLGQFIFPKSVLYEKGVLAKNGQGGKRAMRVYPPWDVPQSAVAKRTQLWQLLYFFEIGPTGDTVGIQKLFLSGAKKGD